MVIYTKRGDKGETSLFDKDATQRIRISKSSLKVEALGAIDELNSFLGMAISSSEDFKLRLTLKGVQENLLTIGPIIAGSKLPFSSKKTKELEILLDKLEGTLPVLKNFIFPGGTKAASLLQYARALARRAERRVVALSEVDKIKPSILTYLNRLSDTLFMLAREVNYKSGLSDEIWKTKK